MIDQNNKSILFIGNYISASEKYTGLVDVLAKKLMERNWHVIMTSNQVSKSLRLMDMLTTIIKQRKAYKIAHIDVFSGQAFIWGYLSSWLLEKLNKPYIITLRGGKLPEFAKKHAILTRKLFSNAVNVTSPSLYLAEKLAGFRKDIQVIPNGIDIDNYPYQKRESPRLNLIWLRAFHKIYNPSLSPHIVAQLVKDGYEDVHLTMIGPDKGDGSLRRTLETIKQLGLNKRILIIEGIPKSQVPIELSKADIFINTTDFDNTPVSVIEAMACGLCIVSTNVGGIPYLLENEIDALLVHPNDSDAMEKAIKRISREQGLAKKLSENGRRKVEKFDWKDIIVQWENLFLQ